MDAEIVLDQNDGLGVREVDVGQVFQDASVIHGGMAICDLDVAPAFERSKHHEEIGGAIALVLIIETGRASRFHRDRHARFGNELLRGLVEANQRIIAVAWPRVDGQHVFHSGYERAVGLRRDDPVLAAMGLKSVFLSARPIVLSLARSTMPSSTTLFSTNRKVQRARPLGGLEQASAISLASFSPSNIRGTAGVARGLRRNTASRPSSTSCLRTRPTIDRLVSKALTIRLSLQPSPAPETSAFSNIRAFNCRRAALLPLRSSLSRCSRSSTLSFTT